MADKKETLIRGIIDGLTLEQKVGQTLVVDFTGLTITPHLVNLITKYNCAGLRVQSDTRIKGVYHGGDLGQDFVGKRSWRDPVNGCKDLAYTNPAPACTAGQYAATLNKVKKLAMERDGGIPLHITLDQEGGGYENFICGDVRLFPTQMGVAATNTKLAYQAYKVMARQLVKSGFSWIHSPVLDVNTNPRNPEIGVRSFSDDPKKVIEMACAMVKAFNEEGLIATGKHFPGRGESVTDAHADLPTVELSRQELMAKHLSPYQALIKAGLPAVMIAHTLYPALESDPIPATVSRRIITDLLRGELGFQGAITTDNLLMNGLIKRFEIPEACILALQAGATLLLPRCESPLIDEVYHAILSAVHSGRLTEEQLDEAIYYNLSVKYDAGLFRKGGIVNPDAADKYQKDPEAKAVEVETARKALTVLRNNGDLPVARGKKVLLVDQVGLTQKNINNFFCHPGMFWELMLEQSSESMCVEVDGYNEVCEKDRQRILRRVKEADVIVATNWEVHRLHRFNTPMVEELLGCGKPVIVVTNSPYRVSEKFPTVLVTFGDNPESLRAVVEVIYGKRKAPGKLPISRLK